MIRQHFLHPRLLLSTMAAALIIGGCGGGSSGSGGTPTTDDPPTEDSATISGTAAAGAPVSGFVGARDASGETLTANIEADGSFEMDLSDLDMPVLLYASGIAGGNAHQMLSVAFADDLNGTANITPLTNLIVANSVGRSPQTFFNNPDFDQIRQATIKNQEKALRARLKPLLDALGVNEDFDLRNSPFTADRAGFDGALDVIEVQIDPDTNTATITNRVNPTQTITNNFVQPESEEATLDVDDAEITESVTTLQALNTLANAFASALESQDETALEGAVTADFLNNGETINELFAYLSGSAPGIEDAGELAAEIRNWSIAELGAGTAKLNIGDARGPWHAVSESGEWKLQGNQLEFYVFVEPTHGVEVVSGTPKVTEVGIGITAGFPSEALGELSDSTVTVSGDLTAFNGDLPLVAEADQLLRYQFLGANAITSGDQVTFTWNNSVAGVTNEEATYTIRRGSPDLSNGAPEITAQSADLAGNEYTFEWTLPAGYDSTSVRNNFTGQTSGGEGNGFTGNPLDNDARSFTGTLPEFYVPSAGDELRIIARDPFGVFVDVGVKNPFAGQVTPPIAEDALIGSWIARNTDRGDNAPWVQLTFLESGYYMHQELDLPYRPEADDAGSTGLEFGQYIWDNETGELTVPNILIDDNGFWGLTDNASGEERISLLVDGDTLTALNPDVGISQSTEFTRVPLNQSGITGSWAIQDGADASNISVLTILDDGFYFIAGTTSQPADSEGQPGLEFGTYTYDGETTVLEPTVASDNNGQTDYNGEFGLSNPMQGFDYATVIDGFLIIDDGEVFQLSELSAGVTPSNGDLTVGYTPPGDGTNPEPEFGISGDFHYLRSSSGVEGQRLGEPGAVFLSSYSYPGTSIVDNGDGTGSINFDDTCLSDIYIDAGINQPPVFDISAACYGASGSLTDLTFTERGATLITPADEFINNDGDQERFSASVTDLFATDATRSLLLGFGKRTFGYGGESGFTSGVNTGVHVLGEKGSGMVPGDLEGNWGIISFQLGDISDNPDNIEYNAKALSVNVDGQGLATLTQEEILHIIQGGNSNNLFVMPESESRPADVSLGNFTVTSDGELGLFNGEFNGFLSLDQSMLFLSAPDPTNATVPGNLGSHEWLVGVRRGATPLKTSDLAGKEYASFGQFYWATEGYFEVDYAKPGATLTFPIDSNIAEYRRQSDFTYISFSIDSDLITGESSNKVGYDFEYSVDASGLLTMTSTLSSAQGTDNVVEYGWANADASMIVIANQYLREPSNGTDTVGGVGVSYLICTNCD